MGNLEKLKEKGFVEDKTRDGEENQPSDGAETNAPENKASFRQKAEELKEKLTPENLKNKAKNFLEDKIATLKGTAAVALEMMLDNMMRDYDSITGGELPPLSMLIGVLTAVATFLVLELVAQETGLTSTSFSLVNGVIATGIGWRSGANLDRFFESRLAPQSPNSEGADDGQDQLSSQGE